MSRLPALAALSALLLLAPPAAAQGAKPGADGTVVLGEAGKRLDRAVTEAVKDFRGAALVAQGGKIVLAKAALTKLYKPEKNGYACGWEVGATRRKTAFARHGGATRGYGAQYLRLLDENAVIAVLTAKPGDAGKVAEKLEATLFPGK